MDLAVRSADRAALFDNLQKVYGITAVAGSLTKPDGLPERVVVDGAVTASSVLEDQAAQRAVDGDPKTGWASNKDRKNAWLMIPLGKRHRITHIGYQSRNGVWERVQSFRLDFGDGTVQLGYLDEKKPTGFQYYDIRDVETDLIRWSVLDTRYGVNTGATEIAVYGVPVD